MTLYHTSTTSAAPPATYSLSRGPSVSSSAAWQQQPRSSPSCSLHTAKLNKSTTTLTWGGRKGWWSNSQHNTRLKIEFTNESTKGGIIHFPIKWYKAQFKLYNLSFSKMHSALLLSGNRKHHPPFSHICTYNVPELRVAVIAVLWQCSGKKRMDEGSKGRWYISFCRGGMGCGAKWRGTKKSKTGGVESIHLLQTLSLIRSHFFLLQEWAGGDSVYDKIFYLQYSPTFICKNQIAP